MPFKAVTCLLILVATVHSFVLESRLSRFEFTQPHMGTRFKIILYAPDSTAAKRASDEAFNRIAQLNQIMSDYLESSELMMLCRQAGGRPVKVSEDLFRILAKSQELAKQSKGAFDVTIGPVVRLWRRARRTGEMPDTRSLAEARDLIGYDKLRLDKKTRSARLDRHGMLLDLGGIAKGYAADEAIKILSRHGISSALVAAGGDIVVSDSPPGTRGWTIGIAPLKSPDGAPEYNLLLKNAAVSTSGDAEQYVEIGGVRYSHIVDPRTGLGVIGRSSATVVAESGTASDSLATAVNVLGPEEGLKLINSRRDAAALIIKDTDQGLRVFESKSWKLIPKVRR